MSGCAATEAMARCVYRDGHEGAHLWEDVTFFGRPFLSVFTPTYQRPAMLELCRKSVRSQTARTEHVVVEDTIGVGIDGMYAAMPEHAGKPTGEYVMVLSDDNILTDEFFAAELRQIALQQDSPDVIVFKGQIDVTTQPASWGGEPRITMIDLSCFAVKREIWQRHAEDWGERYEGDFDFIHALWRAGYRFFWWDRLVFRALQISRGAPEEVAA